jgi:hypothetical protein
MTRRIPVLEGQARNKLGSLLSALRTPGKNTEMVKRRTLGLLAYKPADQGRDAWLRAVLPEAWHASAAIAALSGRTCQDNGSNGQAVEQSNDNGAAPVRLQHGRRRSSSRR